MRRKLGVPVGIISCNWGGTSASAWLDKKYLETEKLSIYLKEYAEAVTNLEMDEYERLNRIFRKGRGTMESLMAAEHFPLERKKAFALGPWSENRPGGLYESMLKRIIPFAARGVIWYQGESDDRKPELYAELFEAMIDCWRMEWGYCLPFLYVQLAPFARQGDNNGNGYPEIRRQQSSVRKEREKVWMISSGDVGQADNLHPAKKMEVGHRLALMALDKIYDQEHSADAPECTGGEKSDKGLELIFTAADGLHIKGKHVNALKLYGPEGEITEYIAQVEKEKLLISGFEINRGAKYTVEFAQSPYYEINLYNAAQIPALPFRLQI